MAIRVCSASDTASRSAQIDHTPKSEKEYANGPIKSAVSHGISRAPMMLRMRAKSPLCFSSGPCSGSVLGFPLALEQSARRPTEDLKTKKPSKPMSPVYANWYLRRKVSGSPRNHLA
eukprot:CAMPEP_0115193908 /NCGR_PEP_ID=MMETSP0270-20121206/13804_1 /TAXON_ID=71861 /ORGANISM="Scrippsiella trochoidea, Strain CCMP3099" /LENGTH=116 /DNA_ID=CAMNT_0002607207 /DNA_START=543 /DNA_END=893 /DNA_ORIENTATION=-